MNMFFKIGDFVTRNSHNNDTTFVIMDLVDDVAYLKGVNIRLYADSDISDLKKVDTVETDDDEFVDRFDGGKLNRDEYFYLPGKVLHIDGDVEYLNRCLNFYKKVNVQAKGINVSEDKVYLSIAHFVEEFKPDILVITGHDAYYKRLGDTANINNYKNSGNFIKSIKEVRKFYPHDKLIIISGACQSNYEELIKSGANFASSPKRINIHALDPAIIASSLAMSDKNKPIDLIQILEKTKYGSSGIGGIITNGTMYVGYPR